MIWVENIWPAIDVENPIVGPCSYWTWWLSTSTSMCYVPMPVAMPCLIQMQGQNLQRAFDSLEIELSMLFAVYIDVYCVYI